MAAMNQFFALPAVCDAIAEIEENKAGLIVLQGERVVFTAATPGIRAALQLHDEHPELLRGAVIADRIIGRAAAMIFADGGAAAIYGSVMSKTARQELTQKGVQIRARTLVDAIINRRGDGICPMEQAITGITETELGLSHLRETVKLLMAAHVEE